MYDVIIIGGGAAGIFAALSAKAARPSAKVTLLEKSAVLLSKVRISGGGRCNVTHSCFDPHLLSQHYPRGEKELVGPFHRFQPRDTIQWFESRGVSLKTEEDGRMFPVTDHSETIIECLLSEAKKLGVEILLKQRISSITKTEAGFEIHYKEGSSLFCRNLILATGNSPEGHAWAQQLGHTIQSPVPSLFTFNVPTSALKELSGIAVERAKLHIAESHYSQTGPLLITHFGFSGPAALKLSAWGARYLHEKSYQVTLIINWLPQFTKETILNQLQLIKKQQPQKLLFSDNPFKFPRNLWKVLLEQTSSSFEKKLADISFKDLQLLSEKLHADPYKVEGKTTHKEEFVTCGGITLKEVNFKTMESKICLGLFFAGEVLDIDGITGGFNFQNAWTTGYISGNASALK